MGKLRGLRLTARRDALAAFASSLEHERSDSAARWRDRVARHACFVAEVDGEQVGIAVGKPSYDGLPHRRDLISM